MAKKTKAGGRTRTKSAVQVGIWMFVPLILVLGVIPLVVQMNLIPLSEEMRAFWTQNQVADFFSYYKSRLLFIVAIWMLCAAGYYMAQGLKTAGLTDRKLYVYYGAAAVFALFAVLSTMLSRYKGIAMWGGPERCEGLIMLLVYLIVMFYAMWAYLNRQETKYLIVPLAVLIAITGVLGVFQFWGHDFFSSEAGQKLIIPAIYRDQGELHMLFESGKIYGTMYHYNYMGSFGAMMVPLFLVLTLFLKDRRQQLFCGIMTAISLFVLLGSTSRAGIVGLALAAVCFLLFFGRKLVEHAKITLGCVAVLVVLVVGVNVATGGLALARIPSLMHDVGALVSSSDVDYHDRIAVREIDLQDNQTTFVFQDGPMLIQKNSDGQPVFTLGNGETAIAPKEPCNVSLGGHDAQIEYVDLDGKETPFVGIRVGDKLEFIVGLYDDGFALVDSRMNKINYEEAPAIGFKGKERLGSARGYIWSRSLPMLFDSLIIGKGPDTFFAEFPQGDLLGKLYAYDTTQMLVDKPHNLYLQIGIGEGCIALLAFLVMMIAYIVDSFRLYAMRKTYSGQQAFGAALALAVIGYLGAGVFNDSIVSVAPIFWVLFGTGIAVNLLNGKQQAQDTPAAE